MKVSIKYSCISLTKDINYRLSNVNIEYQF